ncbi:hypothetical protein IPM62_05910 [Candidatus Woesebacteria bacterium]|nr:MAG: hypothetical protein IPM62_05910 [Candidatus Woesebacteria bacterium]
MKIVIEHEVLGHIDKKLYTKLSKQLKEQYGPPSIKKRIAISFWNPDIKNVETRIRITNGEAELMQKVGEWENKKSFKLQEISCPIRGGVNEIYSLFLILSNLCETGIAPRIIQHKNKIYYSKDFEIKLSKQFGRSEKYLFEIEKVGERSLQEFVNKNGLAKYIKKTDVDFWLKWNEDVNLSIDLISENALKKLITKYLRYT